MRIRSHRKVDLDITPLIDVLFMLIIFFVLTTSFVQGRVEVDLPRGEGTPPREGRTLLVSVKADGTVLWDGTPAASADVPALAAHAVAESRDVLLAGDRAAPYGAVAELLELLRREGLDSAGLALQGAAVP